jgi:hypothetical protein
MNDSIPVGIIREETDPRAKAPLMCRIYRDPEGKPLKHPLTNKFPLLSRRERAR